MSIRVGRRTIEAAIIAILIGATEARAQPIERTCGDADGDGAVTVSDGVQILRTAAALSSGCASGDARCDIDGDGGVTTTDGVSALRIAADLFTAGRCVAGAPRALVSGSEGVARADVVLPGCEEVTAEGRYCLTTTLDDATSAWSLAVLGLESGQLCPLHRLDAAVSFSDEASSFAWRGDIVYACAQDYRPCEDATEGCILSTIVRISVQDGSWEAAGIPCWGVTGDDGALYAMRWPSTEEEILHPFRIHAYPSYEALLAGREDRSYDLSQTTRMTVQGGQLFGARHSTSVVERLDLASGLIGAPLTLEGYDDWIKGLAVTADGELVVSRQNGAGGIVTVFDAGSGAQLRAWETPTPVIGLACATR